MNENPSNTMTSGWNYMVFNKQSLYTEFFDEDSGPVESNEELSLAISKFMCRTYADSDTAREFLLNNPDIDTAISQYYNCVKHPLSRQDPFPPEKTIVIVESEEIEQKKEFMRKCDNSFKLPLKLRGSYKAYVRKHIRSKENAEKEWPKYLGSLVVECRITNYNILEKIKVEDQVSFEPEEIEFAAKNVNKKKKNNGETIKIVQKNWSIKASSLRVYCFWNGIDIGYLSCENEELFVFLLSKEYIFLEGTIVDLNKGSFYSKMKVQLDVFLTEKIIKEPLNVMQVPGRKRGTESEEIEEDEDEKKENQILKLTKESFVKLFILLRVRVNIPTLVEFRQKIDPFQRIQKEKYGKKRKYVGAPAKVITDDFPHYYLGKKKEKTPLRKRKNDWMNSVRRSPDCIIIDLEEDSEHSLEENNDGLGESDESFSLDNETDNQDFLNSDQVSCYYIESTAPKSLKPDLLTYQKQALSWMKYREGCLSKEDLYGVRLEHERVLGELFQEMELINGSKLYFNPFNGEISVDFPVMKTCKGGILADEMGLGKTIMTLALLHTHQRPTLSKKNNSDLELEEEEVIEITPIKEKHISTIEKETTLGSTYIIDNENTYQNNNLSLESEERPLLEQERSESINGKRKAVEFDEEETLVSNKKLKTKPTLMEFENSNNPDELTRNSSLSTQAEETHSMSEDSSNNCDSIETHIPIKTSKVLENLIVSEKDKEGKYSGTSRKVSEFTSTGTLIVVPLTLISQWEYEINKHSMPESLSVYQFYGNSRKTCILGDYDVVITTYKVLESEYAQYQKKGYSQLFDCEWFRVVLDEAHYIKTRQTKTAKAACALKAEYRWCLTGTPLHNKLDDMFSLLQFLRLDTWGEYFWWNTYINKSTCQKEATNLLKSVVNPVLLRRTKKSTYLDGQNILKLPPKEVITYPVKLSDEENLIYNCFFKKSQHQFNEILKNGTLQYEYAHIFELLIRLRQVCDHPSLVFSKGDLKNQISLESAVKKFLQKREEGLNNHPNCVPHINKEEENDIIGSEFIHKTVEKLTNKELEPCAICLEEIDDPAIVNCGHIFCRNCLNLSLKERGTCPLCKKRISSNDVMSVSLNEKCKDLIDMSDPNFQKSSKLNAVLEEVHIVAEKGEKVVIFSQFITMLDLIEKYLKEENVSFRRLDGSCSMTDRQKSIEEFTNKDKGITVFLISLKAGAIGLNLTIANNVFLVDPWWNPAVEDQAVERVHRIGQNNGVKVVRFVCEKTIEERIMQLNIEKRVMIMSILNFSPQDKRNQNIKDLTYAMQGFNYEEDCEDKDSDDDDDDNDFDESEDEEEMVEVY